MDEPVLVAEAGANLANLARRLAKQGFGGLEWAANVPGTVGGAAVNNAGAFGNDTASCLVSITLAGRARAPCIPAGGRDGVCVQDQLFETA